MLDSIPDQPILLSENICPLMDAISTVTISQELVCGFFLQVHRRKILLLIYLLRAIRPTNHTLTLFLVLYATDRNTLHTLA